MSFSAACKARIDFADFYVRAKQAAEKGHISAILTKDIPRGLKPASIPSDLRHD
jgi:hypothetical protein